MRMSFILAVVGVVLPVFMVAGCSGSGSRTGAGPSLSKRVVQQGQRVPKGGGRYKIGKPYQIAGQWFYPRENKRYDRAGIASWYGTMFHGRRTANGEVFDMDALTAAHPTLPLPSLVQVTNLTNGRSIVVRVNDRGPYKHNRVIDLSRYSAHVLGFRSKGTARVRVRYMGKAPLNGDDRYERQVLRQQPWMRMASLNQNAPQVTYGLPRTFGRHSVSQRAEKPQKVRSDYRHVPTAAQVGSLAKPHSGPARRSLLYVQAGVFKRKKNADRMHALMSSLSRVRVDPIIIGGALFHAVRLGPFLSRGQAQEAITRAAEAGAPGARVISSPF